MRKTFEAKHDFSDDESVFERDARERDSSDLSQYWKRLNFRGEAPKPASPLEDRLRNKCREYISMVLDPQLRGAIGENRRRDLHNEIAIMVLGKSRDDLPYEVGEKVSEFASLVATGMTMGKALDDFDQHRRLQKTA